MPLGALAGSHSYMPLALLFGHFGHRLLLVASGSLDLTLRSSDILGFTAVTMGLAVSAAFTQRG